MIQFRPHQIAAADAIDDAFRAGIRRPLASMCVASGKSYTMALVAQRAIERGGRVIIGAHTRELVEQNAKACRELGLQCGINAAALGERTWRAPVISVAIQSVYKYARQFGPITDLLGDECHLWPHSESGMYHALVRGLGDIRTAGFTGTDFRLQGGSLVEGEGAPFDRVVYRYDILDGIRDGYLVPAFSASADDKIDPSKLRTRQGEFTADSQDAQTIDLMDNHIAQMVQHGADRRAWLVFEASTKSAKAMCERMNQWGIPTGLVLGETPAGERAATILAFRQGRLRALVNIAALTTGFDVPETDMLVMRRRTKSLGLYIQMTGRLLRTIGGNIDSSIARGKPDGLVIDFAGNIDQHGPLDFIRPKETKARLVSCETCGKRNAAAAARCWSCSDVMTKFCPACLSSIAKFHLDCPGCGHDMRKPESTGEGAAHKLFDVPSGAALISAYKTGAERQGGWKPIFRVFGKAEGEPVEVVAGDERFTVPASLADQARAARWLRADASGAVAALLLPNGRSTTAAIQVSLDGSQMVVPLPAVAA